MRVTSSALFERQARQDPRKPPDEHGLPGPRRAAEQEVVTARRRELQRPAGAFLPSYLG
jgi:hypothetical protein